MTTSARRELYGIAEIAESLGQSRQLVTVWRRRRTRAMPEPDAELASGPVWRGPTIEPWIDDQIRLSGRTGDAVPLTPAAVQRIGRRLLRLIALLLEDDRRPRLVQQALRETADLVPEIEAAEQNAATVALLRVTAPLAAPEEDLDALLVALVERLPALSETLWGSLTGAESADEG